MTQHVQATHVRATPGGPGSHAPLLGQRTDEVLETLLHLDAEGRDQLRTEGGIE